MIKRIILSSICIMGFSSFALPAIAAEKLDCPMALPTTDANFCASMKTSAQCHCQASGLPAGLCQDVNQLYARLISVFGTLERICAYQHETPQQECIDDWNCYRLGGNNSQGGMCSSTGAVCT